MFDFDKYFKAEYQYALKDINYNLIEKNIGSNSAQIKFSDAITSNIENRQLRVNFCRRVYFEPETIFDLSVAFCVIISFKDDISIDDMNIDWVREFTENENPYLGNIICRAANVISAITSSYGQQPIITPPRIIKE